MRLPKQFIMKKLKQIEGVKILSKNEQKLTKGSYSDCCTYDSCPPNYDPVPEYLDPYSSSTCICRCYPSAGGGNAGHDLSSWGVDEDSK